MKTNKPHGYMLVSPSEKVIPETFDVTLEGAQSRAFDYLHNRYAWAAPFWKQWNAFIDERTKRGWFVCPVRVSEVFTELAQ